VFPEGSLTERLARETARVLARLCPKLELFIAGTLSEASAGNAMPRNKAYTCRTNNGEVLREWDQSKHHRWCLDESQIPRYQLGHALNPQLKWWEKIDIDDRACVFSLIRPGASLAVLVCEDLARFDPALPVLSAVGPNLVIALLMDGPQLERRWPGRYATVLADDPGSSVLTLTCVGILRRSGSGAGSYDRNIALWKEPGGETQELQLGKGDAGLVLTLQPTPTQQITLDVRLDGGTTHQLKLTGIHSIGVSKDKIPAGLDL